MRVQKSAISQSGLRVLVTGGSGFVGRAVIRQLLERGHSIIATAREQISETLDASLRWLRWNALEAPLPDAPWDDIDVVLHLALPRQKTATSQHVSEMYEVTVAATFRLLQRALQGKARRFLLASTGDVLGCIDHVAYESDDLYRPVTFYGSAKACAEVLTKAFMPVLSAAVLRFYHPYGPGGDGFLINRLLRMVREGVPICIDGENGIWINPVWIDDLSKGVCLAVESRETGTFHFAGPETLTLRQLLDRMGDAVARTPIIQSSPSQPSFSHVGAFEQTTSVLGYRPVISPRTGIEQLAAGFSAV